MSNTVVQKRSDLITGQIVADEQERQSEDTIPRSGEGARCSRIGDK